ncbi:hypothetical protein D0X99_05235 [Algoriphagus lacus]|uniref:Uncharacterized protein n=1 Tax=Algoriphagus lacus TaxID=2056311 RepID=A0A418PU37_9BACT|nr:hypothetical protein [Algoriphagus lacus]RIW17158.1 hypothetical protein D0X99_05235 [Algoriphagus lacus]
MQSQTSSAQDFSSVYGQIEIQNYSIVFNVQAKRDHLGYHLPETIHQVILKGKNLSGHQFSTVDIRFREPKNIVTNPAGSADTVIIDMPKSDYSLFENFLKKTIDSKDSPRKLLIMEYTSSPNKYEYNTTFLIR